MRPFIQSVIAGLIAGAFFPVVLSILIAFSFTLPGFEGAINAILFALLPIGVVLAFVLAGSLIVGIPATLLLSRSGQESLRAYVCIGAITGFILPLLVLCMMDDTEVWWVAFLGAFSGGITGRTWWISARQAVAD